MATAMAPERNTARDEILRRITAANGQHAPRSTGELSSMWAGLPRSYRRRGSMAAADMLALLDHRLRDYGAGVETCAAAEVARTLTGMIERRGVRTIAVPEGFPAAWLPPGPQCLLAETLNARDLDRCDGVLTGTALAIAETGTLVLQAVAGQGRRAATLVPDYHLCVLRASDVVQTVPEAFARLEPTKTLPTTFVSGPSATADIEMTRIKGVHGPRFLDVLLVT